MNPWGVTDKEAEALDAIIKAGGVKRAAYESGIPVKTLESRINSVRIRMGMESEGTHFRHLLSWQHFRLTGRPPEAA